MKHRRIWLGFNLITICAVTMMLAGCSSPSIFREYKIHDDKATSILIDAKQRAILAVHSPQLDMPKDNGTQNKPKETDASGPQSPSGENKSKKNDPPTRLREVIVCAEPSPDALSGLSSMLSASIGNDGTENATVKEVLEEIVKKLGERNATIQLLRDGLYRQCEAYLNGMIDEEEYKALADRYIDGMVALLAIERITPDPADEKEGQFSSHAKLYSEKAVEAVEEITRAFLAKNHLDECIDSFSNDKKPDINLCFFIATSKFSEEDRKLLLSRASDLENALEKNSGLNKETTSALGLTREKLTVTNETLGTTNENITKATTALDETKKELTATNANLTNTTSALSVTKKELTATKDTLTKTTDDLGKTNEKLDGTTASLSETKKELVNTLTATNDELGKATGALNQTKNELTETTKNLGKATDALNATNTTLNSTNEKLDKISKSPPKSDSEAGENAESLNGSEAKTSQETNGQVPDEGETADKKSQQ